jgi:hypothetical protein
MIRNAGGQLLARAQQAGSARPGIAITDLLTLARAIAQITEQEPDGPDQADHILAIAINGIRQGESHAP